MSYDVLVIGSGAGGLTAAVALARAGQRVLVLEQHDVPGGWCHSFRLGGHTFSPGVHYIGELEPGGRARAIYEGLGLGDRLTFLELNPDGYDHAIIGDERFDIPKGKERFIERLKQRFPKEARGIDRYFSIITRMRAQMGDFLGRPKPGLVGALSFPFRSPTLAWWGLRPIQSLLDATVSDPMLRAILLIQTGDHGLPPDRAPAAVHGGIHTHYFEGAWYPKGGGAALPRAFIAELKKYGGELKVRASVQRILTEPAPGGGHRVTGVRLADGTEIRSKFVVSNADPAVTYGSLLPDDQVPSALRKRLAKTEWSVSSLSLFFAVEDDVEARGLDSGNYWYSSTTDIGRGYPRTTDAMFEGEFPGQFLTVTTLKDRSKGNGRVHTMESFVLVPYEPFKRWAHTRFGERPADYAAMKEDLTERMLRGLDRFVPGLSEKVTFRELGTPLTNEHYCRATRGNLYGTDKTARQVGPFAWRTRSPVEGLFLCGASTVSHGVMGAQVSGLFAAASALRVDARELLDPRGPSLKTYPCDDTSEWPEAFRERIALKHDSAAQESAPADV